MIPQSTDTHEFQNYSFNIEWASEQYIRIITRNRATVSEGTPRCGTSSFVDVAVNDILIQQIPTY